MKMAFNEQELMKIVKEQLLNDYTINSLFIDYDEKSSSDIIVYSTDDDKEVPLHFDNVYKAIQSAYNLSFTTHDVTEFQFKNSPEDIYFIFAN